MGDFVLCQGMGFHAFSSALPQLTLAGMALECRTAPAVVNFAVPLEVTIESCCAWGPAGSLCVEDVRFSAGLASALKNKISDVFVSGHSATNT